MIHRAVLAPRDRAAIDDFVPRVREALGGNLLALKLFGSKASGRDTAESDIDVLVLLRKADAAVEDCVLEIAFDVNLAHEVYISPRVVAESVLHDPVWRRSRFVQTLIHEAVPL